MLVRDDVVFVLGVRRLVVWGYVDGFGGQVRGAGEFLGVVCELGRGDVGFWEGGLGERLGGRVEGGGILGGVEVTGGEGLTSKRSAMRGWEKWM